MRAGEKELLASIGKRFKEKKMTYLMEETADGYVVHPQDNTTKYIIHHNLLGWFMHIEVKDDSVFDLDMTYTHPFSEIWDDINEINFHHYQDSEEIQAHLEKQRKLIEQKLFPFSKMLASRKAEGNKWHYEVKSASGKKASFTIIYLTQEKLWDIDFVEFMQGYHFHPELYDLYEAVTAALDECNRENVALH